MVSKIQVMGESGVEYNASIELGTGIEMAKFVHHYNSMYKNTYGYAIKVRDIDSRTRIFRVGSMPIADLTALMYSIENMIGQVVGVYSVRNYSSSIKDIKIEMLVEISKDNQKANVKAAGDNLERVNNAISAYERRVKACNCSIILAGRIAAANIVDMKKAIGCTVHRDCCAGRNKLVVIGGHKGTAVVYRGSVVLVTKSKRDSMEIVEAINKSIAKIGSLRTVYECAVIM